METSAIADVADTCNMPVTPDAYNWGRPSGRSPIGDTCRPPPPGPRSGGFNDNRGCQEVSQL